MTETTNQVYVGKEDYAQTEKRKVIDFKMVTFTLAGKDYGIDIMKVKEISKIGRFTYVPNTAPYVKGVYNLRGDIISVVDLRTFFNLDIESRGEIDQKQVNMIILRLQDRSLAAIVDSIDKVVGISRDAIQPPHPLFGDINIKYISGIVENDNRLYILLDVDKIFLAESSDTAKKEVSPAQKIQQPVSAAPSAQIQKPVSDSKKGNQGNPVESDLHLKFIEETLSTFKRFYVTEINRDWISVKFESWKKGRGKDNWQLQNEQDATTFLAGFVSPCSGQLWTEDYSRQIDSLLTDGKRGNLNVWNPGCGNGYETYSLAVLLKKKYPETLIKIRANDNDLISISMAPGLMFDKESVPGFYHDYMTDGSKGSQFKKEIKDTMIFEYHDVGHDNTLPVLDLIMARDVLSYLTPDNQQGFMKAVEENLKPGGFLILGAHERLFETKGWEFVEKSGVIAYKKR
jgi:purine-binding chemotaxis protein CheW